jgi:hypothetical protein
VHEASELMVLAFAFLFYIVAGGGIWFVKFGHLTFDRPTLVCKGPDAAEAPKKSEVYRSATRRCIRSHWTYPIH